MQLFARIASCRANLPCRLHADADPLVRRPMAGAAFKHSSPHFCLPIAVLTRMRALWPTALKSMAAPVHFVVPALDEGPIIAQAAVAVLDSDTPESLAARVLLEEHAIYPAALACVAEGRLRVEGNRVYINEPAALPISLRVPFGL